jgi:hypothetical protein
LLSAHAAELAGVTLKNQKELGDQTLMLHGIGLREKYWLDIYVAGLYLPTSFLERKASATEIISANVPKSIHTEFIFPNVSKEKMVETLEENIQNNPNITPQTQEKMKQCQSWMEDYTSGDQIIFDYIPTKGTTITVKGTTKGTIEGTDFMRALFEIYIGPNPASEQLKQGLLNQHPR